MLEILSGGEYKSTLHRVLTINEKYSLAFFFEPNMDCIISPYNCNDLYKPIKFSEYFGQKISESQM